MTPLTSLHNILKKQNLDAALITSLAQITYLTHYASFSSHERDAYLLVTRQNSYLFTNPLYFHEVKRQVKDCNVLEITASHPFSSQLKEIVEEENIHTLGIEATDLRVNEYQDLKRKLRREFSPLDLSSLRLIKTSSEIENIQKACEIGDRAFQEIHTKLHLGITEKELAFELEILIRSQSADLSFPTIVAFGENSAFPHHQPDTTPLQKNDTVLIDFGVKVDNYCSDMTRTFFVGIITEEQQRVYQTVLKAQKEAVTFITTELKTNDLIKAKEVDQKARDYIISQNYPSLPHSLGHGIGIEVHEAPKVSPKSNDMLTDGMVFSIEPGIYLPEKFGIRIEDLYVIENNSLRKLTQAKHATQHYVKNV